MLPFFMQRRNPLSDLVRFVYPHTCAGCGYELYHTGRYLCLHCLQNLPVTGYWKTGDNYVASLFAGRLPFEKAAAWLFYNKAGLTQQLIHAVKYRDNPELGHYLGYVMGMALQQDNWFAGMDVLVPLPLNKKKLLSRGYNQSALICKGIAEATRLPVADVAVLRTVYTQTQTRKSRLQRWANVAQVFDLAHTEPLQGKHVLLVDDVVTTGATLDACGQVLLRVPGLRISILTLAVASPV